MERNFYGNTKILYMTNGIFLQRFIHNARELLLEFPFIVLDEVHERDIDTDFILLSVMHVLREYPSIRLVLMSATIDNNLFKHYFAQEHVDIFLNKENFYMKQLRALEKIPRRKKGEFSSSDEEERKITEKLAEEFMSCKGPCPEICITEKGTFKKDVFYLDTLSNFTKREMHIPWGQLPIASGTVTLGR